MTQGNKKLELMNLCKLFKNLFENRVGDDLETSAYGKLSLYMLHDDQDFLENFVKEYFVMCKLIVDNINAMINFIKSDEFKNEKFITKIIVKKELKYWQKLCGNINKFEKEFYEKTNISLLRVENERLAKEQADKRAKLIEQ